MLFIFILRDGEKKPISNSRDTQEIPRNEGEIFLKVFDEFKYHTCILQQGRAAEIC